MRQVFVLGVVTMTVLFAGSAMACPGMEKTAQTTSPILASGTSSSSSPILLPPVTGSGQ